MGDPSPEADPDAIDLRILVAHAHSVAAAMTVEAARGFFAQHDVDFVAVLSEGRLIGACARRDLVASLGSRYGFALNAHRPISEHLMSHPLRIAAGSAITEVFQKAAARDSRDFYDDVLLVDANGNYEGMIPMHTLVQLQTRILLQNIADLERSRREIAAKSWQMEEELRMAGEVQLAMLPSRMVGATSRDRLLRVAHRYRPAGGMSGDYFEVLPLSEHTVGILICDVMGHGVRSALVTMMVRALMESLRSVASDPGALLTRLNGDLTRMLRRSGEVVFVTAAYLVLDVAATRLYYAQAGHPPPLRWWREHAAFRPIACDGSCAGPALGLIEEFSFATHEEPLAEGDRVVLFTDGLCEAVSPADEEFGVHRLAEALARNRGSALEDCLDGVLDEAVAFVQGTFADDVCLIAAEVGLESSGPRL